MPVDEAVGPVRGGFVGPGIERSRVGIVVPTRNATRDWPAFAAGLKLQGFPPEQVLVIDSDSEDGTRQLAAEAGFRVHRIEKRDFNHGGTRQLAITLLPWAEVLVYLTQDAVLASPNSVDLLLAALKDASVGAAYGRQLPRTGAGPIEAHARLFNYPPTGCIKDLESRHVLGIKAAFLSNSFSVFRVRALLEAGGFPTAVIMAEDTLVTGRLLLKGWKVAYVAEAAVYHSHPYGMIEEFRRYFDTGVYHRREAWLRDAFGNAGSEGKRYILSELKYLAGHAPLRIPEALLRTGVKLAGYQLGLRYRALGVSLSRRLSMHKGYWPA